MNPFHCQTLWNLTLSMEERSGKTTNQDSHCHGYACTISIHRGGCSSKNDRFQKHFCDLGSGNSSGSHPFLSQETTSRNTISHSHRHWELGRNLQENIIFSKFAL